MSKFNGADNARYTNDGVLKGIGLTREQRVYRAGYKNANIDHIRAYGNKNKPKG